MSRPSDAFLETIFITIGILLVMGYGYKAQKTDWTGSISGGVIALLIYFSIGIPGLIYFLVFFIVGSQASKWKYQQKVELGVAQENKAKRKWVHAFSNAGPAALLALLTFIGFSNELAHIAIACTFATALSDTLSSELGNILGKQFYNILTFETDKRGEDGVISAEGSIAGGVGSLLIALLYLIFTFDWMGFMIVFFMGIGSNLIDSVLGATLQRQHYLNNHLVNLLSTFLAGVGGILLYLLLSLIFLLFN